MLKKSHGPCVSKERCVEILTEEIQDLLVGPPLDGRPVADADDFGQPARIYSFYI